MKPKTAAPEDFGEALSSTVMGRIGGTTRVITTMGHGLQRRIVEFYDGTQRFKKEKELEDDDFLNPQYRKYLNGLWEEYVFGAPFYSEREYYKKCESQVNYPLSIKKVIQFSI